MEYYSIQNCLALRADLRHNLAEEDDIRMHYLANYIYKDELTDKKMITYYEDTLEIKSQGKHPELIEAQRARGQPIIRLDHHHIGNIEIRFSAAWHEPFEQFWIIKKDS